MPSRLSALLPTVLPGSKLRARFRKAWGAPGDNEQWRASAYFDLVRDQGGSQVVDDKTWMDLEFPKLFSIIDATITPIGRQFLFNQLRTYEYDTEKISRREESYEALQTDVALRESIQLSLSRLNVTAVTYIVDLLFGPPPARPRPHALILPWALLSTLTVAGAFLHMIPLWFCATVIGINIVIHSVFSPKLDRDAEALTNCGRLLTAADQLARGPGKDSASFVSELAAETGKRNGLKRHVRLLAALDRARSINFLAAIVILGNLCLLLKFAVYTLSIDRFIRHRSDWLSTFRLVGEADAAVAIANFLHRVPAHCRAVVSEDQVIAIENGYHPLLATPVKNSIALSRESALVTGSNMAGKTTFIKMVAINVILAHTIGSCLADKATIPRSGVMASIRGDQSVISGKSRYFAEAEAIRSFIEESANGQCRIFVIDEPFSGTNTTERVATATAVLDAIGAHSQALVTTHDIELQHLLSDHFRLFHFQEDPAVEGFFDYRLREGAGMQRNAILVLERMGFPADIIARALALVAASSE
jgi:hypothetical protein